MVLDVSTLEKLTYQIIHADLVLKFIQMTNGKAPSWMVSSMALVCHSACRLEPNLNLFLGVFTGRDRREYEVKNYLEFGKKTNYWSE